MGTWFHLIAVGPDVIADRALAQAESMLADLEARWSRFVPSSDISRLNAARPGTPVPVSAETVELVQCGVDAWCRTNGAFDPTMLHTTIATGYDRPFDELATARGPAADELANTGPSTGHDRPFDELAAANSQSADEPFTRGDDLATPPQACGRIVVDPDAGTVTLPEGCGFDPGGIGKGLAADLVAEAALGWGVDGVLVNLGGDLRCAGHPPEPGWWTVQLPDVAVVDGRATIQLVEGGVATSTPRLRRWMTARGTNHHLIDPTLGRPTSGGPASVTVVARSACDAETTATAIAARQPDGSGKATAPPCSLGGAAALITSDGGRTAWLNGIERYLR